MSVYVRLSDPPPARVEFIPIEESAAFRIPDELIEDILLIAGRNYGILNKQFLLSWNTKKVAVIENLNQNYVFRVLYQKTIVNQENLTKVCYRIQKFSRMLSKSKNVNLKKYSFASLLISPDKCDQMMSLLAKTLLSHKIPIAKKNLRCISYITPFCALFTFISFCVGMHPEITYYSGITTGCTAPFSGLSLYLYLKSYLPGYYWEQSYTYNDYVYFLERIQMQLEVSPGKLLDIN